MLDNVGHGWKGVLNAFNDVVVWDIEYNNMPPVNVYSTVDKNNKFKIEFTGGNMQTVAYARLANTIANLLEDEEENVWRKDVVSL